MYAFSRRRDRLGNVVMIDRAGDGNYDRYAHLPSCPFTGMKHFEQGDFISNAGTTGNSSGIHLHYQLEDSTGQSLSYSLSGWSDFTNATYGDPTSSSGCLEDECHAFVSDNAGPGVGAPASIATKIRSTYVFLGHLFPSPCGNSWDCFGSSSTVFGDGRPAAYDCVGPPGETPDCGWNQDFRDPRGARHNFNLADDCSNDVHWVPGDIFEKWLQNTDLGQARGPVIRFERAYYQTFRYGVLWTRTLASPTFGGIVEVKMTVDEPNNCYA